MNISECTDIFCNGQTLTKLYSGKYLIWQKKKSPDYIFIITITIIPNANNAQRTVHLKDLGGVIDWGDGNVDEKTRKHVYPANATTEAKNYTIKVDVSNWIGSGASMDGDEYEMSTYIPNLYGDGARSVFTSFHVPAFRNAHYPFLLWFTHSDIFSNVKSLTFDENFFGDVLDIGFPMLEKLSLKVFSRLTFKTNYNNSLKELSVTFTSDVKEFSLGANCIEKLTIDCKKMITRSIEGCSRLNELIMKNVEVIDSYAFKYCPYLTTLTLPETLTTINNYAFYGGSWSSGSAQYVGITSITIPKNVRSIGKYAFYRLGDLETMIILNGLTEIGDSIIDSCKKLTEITIPKSVTKISDKAFPSSNTSLKTIKGIAGSYAETWARNHGFEFVAI